MNQICNLLSMGCPVWNQSGNASLSKVLNKSTELTTAITASFNKSQSAAGNRVCTLSTQQRLPSVGNTYSPSQKHSRDALWSYWRSYSCNFCCRYHLTVPPVGSKTSQEAARQAEEMMVNGHHMAKQAWSWVHIQEVDLEIRSDECRFSQGNLNAGHHKEKCTISK